MVSETPQVGPTLTAIPHVNVTSSSGGANSSATSPAAQSPADGFSPPDIVEGVDQVTEMRLRGQVFRLEIARTSDERARGLMNRESLPDDAAMLFVFESESRLSFWMKNTLIPLDILYLDAAGIVVDIHTMLPEPGVADSDLEQYPSAAFARYALEMNAGLTETYEFSVGDQVHFR